jgi:hypothetical protein
MMLQSGGPGPHVYIPQEQGGTVIPLGMVDNPMPGVTYAQITKQNSYAATIIEQD